MDRFPPQFAINWGHQQAQGLVFAFLGQHPGSNLCFDSSLYGNHGTLTSMDPPNDWVWGHHGMALDFDGSDDFVLIGDKEPATTEMTISLWLNADVWAGTPISKYSAAGKAFRIW